MVNLHIIERLKTFASVIRHGGLLIIPTTNIKQKIDPEEEIVIKVTHNGRSNQIVLPSEITDHLRHRVESPELLECVAKRNPYAIQGESCFTIISQRQKI